MTRKTDDETAESQLPKPAKERNGNRFRVVRLSDGAKIIPLAETPVEGLRSALGGLQDVRLDEIKAVSERRGRRKAGVER